jgi:hypothetical protein
MNDDLPSKSTAQEEERLSATRWFKDAETAWKEEAM